MKTIGQYQVQEEIGQGGTATVYRALDPNNEVAIKLMRHHLTDDVQTQERFAQEAKFVTTLQHPTIVPILGFGEIDGRLYIVMPYMEGGSLRERLEVGPLSLIESIHILDRIASALDATHAHNIIHRDIKPHNILLDADGQVYLSDFGVARLLSPDEPSQTVTLVGTPEFVAPEQATVGHLTPQTDIYQLGVTLFQMLTGKQPFSGSSFQVISQHLKMPVPSVETLNPTLPPGCDAILQRAMAKEPANRYPSARALVQDLKALCISTTSTQLLTRPFIPDEIALRFPSDQPVTTTQPHSMRRSFALAIASLLLITALTLAFINQPSDTINAQLQDIPSLLLLTQNEPSELNTLTDDLEKINEGNVLIDDNERDTNEQDINSIPLTTIGNGDNGNTRPNGPRNNNARDRRGNDRPNRPGNNGRPPNGPPPGN